MNALWWTRPSPVVSPQLRCKACEQSFGRQDKLDRHVQKAHGGKVGGNRRWLLAGALLALVLVVAFGWLDGNAEPAPQTRAENLAAFAVDSDPFLGNASAPVVLVGFESPHCTACQYFHQNVLPQIKSELIDSGRVVYYYAQSTWGHDQDFAAGVAQECVAKHLGAAAFWEMTEGFYARSQSAVYGTYDLEAEIRAAAHDTDPGPALACFESQATAPEVRSDWNAARRAGAQGTPAFFVFGPEGPSVRASTSDVRAVLYDALLEVPE